MIDNQPVASPLVFASVPWPMLPLKMRVRHEQGVCQ